jgi:hypothetical protein
MLLPEEGNKPLTETLWLEKTRVIYHSLTHGSESFLRNRQLCSYSKILSIVWNLKVHYRVHKSPPLTPILSQINPMHSILSYLPKIHFNIVHPRLAFPSGLFPFAFPTNILYAFRFSPIRATYPTYLILLGLIILIIFGEEYMFE